MARSCSPASAQRETPDSSAGAQHDAHSLIGPLAYLSPDARRDSAAVEILEAKQISTPTFQEYTRTFKFDCFSSTAVDAPDDPNTITYALSVCLDGSAQCSCPDFANPGGAFKHIRAALLRLDELRRMGLLVPHITLPRTLADISKSDGAR